MRLETVVRRVAALALCVVALSCTYVQQAPGGAAPEEQRFPTAAVHFGAASERVGADGLLPCTWLNDRASAVTGLAYGTDAAGTIRGLTFVAPGSRCSMDPTSTARSLVVIAAGGLTEDEVTRLALWRGTADMDLRAIERALSESGGLQQALSNTTWRQWINDGLRGAVEYLVGSVCPLANIVRNREAAGAGVTLEGGNNDGVMLTVSRTDDQRRVRIRAEISDHSRELKAVVVNGETAYLRSAGTPDPMRIFRDVPAATTRRDFLVESTGAAPTFDVAVIAPAGVGRLADLVRGSRLNLRGELIYSDVMMRTLVGQAANILIAVGLDRARALTDNGTLGAGGDPCLLAMWDVIYGTAQRIADAINTGRSPGETAVELFNLLDAAVTGGRLVACRTAVGGAFTRFAGALGDILEGANPARFVAENACAIVDASFGPSIAIHTVNVCAACGGAAPFPACTVRGGALTCGGMSGCDPAMVNTRCDAGMGPCAAVGVWACVNNMLQCTGIPGRGSDEVCNGRDDDCDGSTDEGLDRPCGVNVGACRQGVQRCVMGAWTGCTGGVSAGTETCNGVDDDCDGSVDELLHLWTCTPAGAERTRCDRGMTVRDPCPSGCTARPVGTDDVCCAPSCEGRCGGASNGCRGTCDAPCTAARTLHVDAPNGGERLTAGTAYRVRWSATGRTDAVRVELREGGSPVATLAASVASGASGGGWDFTPSAGHAGRRFTVRVVATDDATVADESDAAFEVVAGAAPPCDPREGTACSAGDGACRRDGTNVCVGGALRCNAVPGIGSMERCDNVDNDCDRVVDNGVTQPCYGAAPATAGVGLCRRGTQTCSAGAWGGCVGEVTPTAEVCGNGLDEDCDGAADDGCAVTPRCPDRDLGGATGAGVASGSTTGAGLDQRGSCVAGSADAPDVAFRWVAPSTGTYTFSTEGSAFDTVLYVLDGGCTGRELACNDDVAGGTTSSVSVPLSAGQAVVVVVDGYSASSVGAYALAIRSGGGCATNYCQTAGRSSGAACDGADLVTCTSAGGCNVEASRMRCPGACAAGACVATCSSNYCQTNGLTSGAHCDGSDRVTCGASGACGVETGRSFCPAGCSGGACRTVCASNYCQDRGLTSGTRCDGDVEVTCGISGTCGVEVLRRTCGAGCAADRCNACASNYCQNNGQSGGSFCDGADLVTCGTAGICRIESSRVRCPAGCSGGACGAVMTRVFQQSYDSTSLFPDGSMGSVTFADGEQFYALGPTTYVRRNSAYAGAYSLGVYQNHAGAYSNTWLSFPASARSDETLRVAFWAYNPFAFPVTIHLQRPGGTRVTQSVSPGAWTRVTADVRSGSATGSVGLYLGEVPNGGGGVSFRVDELTIDRF